MSPNKERAIAALLIYPTREEAAKAAGLSSKTVRRYWDDPEFVSAYKKAFSELVEGATRQAQRNLEPAVNTLQEIMRDNEQNGQIRVSAARSLLEYSLRLSERVDILERLDELEKSLGGTNAKH